MLSVFVLTMPGCEKPGSADCEEEVICTEEFRTLTVELKDENGDAITLSKVVVTLGATGDTLYRDALINSVPGVYALANDNHLELLKSTGSKVVLHGYENDDLLVSNTYWVGHNCCHVELLEVLDLQLACPDEIICSLLYTTLLVEILDEAGEPLVLTSYKVTIADTGDNLHFDDSLNPAPGFYPIAEDAHFSKINRLGTDLRFRGFINDNKVVDQLYIVGHDCCHVLLLGKKTSSD